MGKLVVFLPVDKRKMHRKDLMFVLQIVVLFMSWSKYLDFVLGFFVEAITQTLRTYLILRPR